MLNDFKSIVQGSIVGANLEIMRVLERVIAGTNDSVTIQDRVKDVDSSYL